jgi:hypothetical protein
MRILGMDFGRSRAGLDEPAKVIARKPAEGSVEPGVDDQVQVDVVPLLEAKAKAGDRAAQQALAEILKQREARKLDKKRRADEERAGECQEIKLSDIKG